MRDQLWLISRFGALDPSDGGHLDLFSNLTYYLNDSVHSDQREQAITALLLTTGKSKHFGVYEDSKCVTAISDVTIELSRFPSCEHAGQVF